MLNVVSNGMPIEIYDTDLLEWSSHFTFDKLRHSTFIVDKFVFSQGGYDSY